MMGKGCLSLFLGWGVGCRKQWEQKSPWSWGRRRVAGRNRQAPSGLLFWAREFKQALNLNGEKSSPPRSPPKEALHFPVRGAKSGCGCPAGLRPCFPTQLSLRAGPAILLLAWVAQPWPGLLLCPAPCPWIVFCLLLAVPFFPFA